MSEIALQAPVIQPRSGVWTVSAADIKTVPYTRVEKK